MIDEVRIQCFGCNQWGFLMVYDPELQMYFCPECCEEVGHEPPFTHEELLKLTNKKKKV